ncbi:hypothetical protein E2C01_037305 [Portunus trituberculatus]|uniref:Uncharacterized protein n=1 Tax=Portunus trituberculatus TaxID=210409 RepID=A0A5B7FB26_PORTR|nr:hypothetical protein [Portunus trituberculatus]
MASRATAYHKGTNDREGRRKRGYPQPCPTLDRLGRSCRIVVYKGPGRGRRGLNRHAGLPRVPDGDVAADATTPPQC